MLPERLIKICQACPDRKRPCAGPCPCLLDGVDIIEHAKGRYCPAGRYQLGLGDKVAGVLHRTGIGPAYKKLRGKVTNKPCGCSSRQHALNVLMPSKEEARQDP
jgi:hypothetical protein